MLFMGQDTRILLRKLVLLGIVDSGRVPGDETSWMEPPAVIPASAVVIATVAAPVMIATAIAPGARVISGIGIPITASVGSRSRTIPTTAAEAAGAGVTPTTAAPGQGVGGQEKRCHTGGNSERE
jgi:hypothetical protein